MSPSTNKSESLNGFQRFILRIHKILSYVAQFLAYIAAIALLLMVGHILVEIALRNFFNTSTYVLDEFVGYLTAAITFNTLAYAFERNVLIRVHFILNAFSTKQRVVAVLENIAILLTLGVIGMAIIYFWGSILRAYKRGAVSETVAEFPMWIPEAAMLLGLIVFWLILFSRFTCAVLGISTATINANVPADLLPKNKTVVRG